MPLKTLPASGLILPGQPEEPKVTISTISVTYERKFNLGDYNSAGYKITVFAKVEGDPNMAAARLFEGARELVRQQAAPVVGAERAMIATGQPTAQLPAQGSAPVYEKMESIP